MQEDESSQAALAAEDKLNEAQRDNVEQPPNALESNDSKTFSPYHQWQSTRREHLYVDKSLLILEMIKPTGHHIIARPRRWGKSTNLEMLKTFFDCPLTKDGKIDEVRKYLNRQLFIGTNRNRECYYQKLTEKLTEQQVEQLQLEIKQQGELGQLFISKHWEKCERHFANYIVFHMSLYKSVTKCNASLLNVAILKKVLCFFSQHEYLSKVSATGQQVYWDHHEMLRDDIMKQDANLSPHYHLCFITRTLFKHHEKQTIVLIDEYDHWATSTLLDDSVVDSERQEILNSISGFIAGFSKCDTARYVWKLVATGIRHVLLNNNFSSASHRISTIAIQSPLHKYYGFTESEVEGIVRSKFKSQGYEGTIQHLLDTIKRLYNGYKVIQDENGKKEMTIYNPFSVGSYVNLCAEDKRIHDEKEKQFQSQLGFWINTGPNQKLISKYLAIMDAQNQATVFYLFTTLMNNYNQSQKKQLQFRTDDLLKFEFLPKATEQIRWELVDKNTLQYNMHDFLHLLVTLGYLTVQSGKIKVPNEEMFVYYNKVLLDHMRRIVREVQQQMPPQARTLNLHNWNECQQVFKETIGKCLSRFYNFCEALFTALMMIDVMASSSSSYRVLYEKKLHKMKPDVIFVPDYNKWRGGKLPIIIHKHKRMDNVHYNQESASQLARKALIQIFQKNYFKSVLEDEECKGIQWDELIVRGVVGHYSKRGDKKFSIFAIQQKYPRRTIGMLSQLASFYYISKNFPSPDQIVYPRLLDKEKKEKAADILQLAELLSPQSQSFSLEISQQNLGVLTQFQYDISNNNYHNFSIEQINFLKALKGYLQMRFFGFQYLISDKKGFQNSQAFEGEVEQFYVGYTLKVKIQWKFEDCRLKVKEMLWNALLGFRCKKTTPSGTKKGSPVKRLSSKIKS